MADALCRANTKQALITFARLLQETFRESDVLGRLGGDEFAALLTNASDEALKIALRRLRQAVESCNHETSQDYNIAYSVGAVRFDAARHADIGDMLVEADALMYEQKRQSQEKTWTDSGR